MKKLTKARWQNIRGFILFSSATRFLYTLFLFPLFFVLHAYNENFGLIPTGVTLLALLKYVVITWLVIAASLFLFISPRKAFLFAFYLLAVYFLFGALHDFLKDFSPVRVIYSFSFLLPFLAVLTLLLFVLLHRLKDPLRRIVKYLGLLLLVYGVLDLSVLVYNFLSGKNGDNNLSDRHSVIPPAESLPPVAAADMPDIFFIVLDGYTSSKALQDEFGFSNAAQDSIFARNGFYLSHLSESNYNITPFSISSSLDLNYLQPGIEKVDITNKRLMQGVATMEHVSIVPFLQEKGYECRNYGFFKLNNMPLEYPSYFEDFYYAMIDQQTLLARVDKGIGWHFTTRNIFTGAFKVPSDYKERKAYHLSQNQLHAEELMEELSRETTTPRFIYTHLMLPHEPFYLDSGGQEVSDSLIVLNKLDLKKGYLGQVQYTNNLLQKILPLAVKKTVRNRIVIIQGDHGYRFYSNEDLHMEFPNLNAYYFSDGDYRLLYNGISPVNSFRVVLNKYFHTNLGMLKDSSVYLYKPGQRRS